MGANLTAISIDINAVTDQLQARASGAGGACSSARAAPWWKRWN
jgi:hypothetical protein